MKYKISYITAAGQKIEYNITTENSMDIELEVMGKKGQGCTDVKATKIKED